MVTCSNIFRFQMVSPRTVVPLRSCNGDRFDGDVFDEEKDDRPVGLDSEENVEDRLMTGPVEELYIQLRMHTAASSKL